MAQSHTDRFKPICYAVRNSSLSKKLCSSAFLVKQKLDSSPCQNTSHQAASMCFSWQKAKNLHPTYKEITHVAPLQILWTVGGWYYKWQGYAVQLTNLPMQSRWLWKEDKPCRPKQMVPKWWGGSVQEIKTEFNGSAYFTTNYFFLYETIKLGEQFEVCWHDLKRWMGW